MLFEKFSAFMHKNLDDYFKFVARAEGAGELSVKDVDVLYPRILLVVNCGGYFVAELMGFSVGYRGLIVKRHAQKSIHRYFDAFYNPESSGFGQMRVTGPNATRTMCFSNTDDFDKVVERFPAVEFYQTRVVCKEAVSFFEFSEDFVSSFIQDSIFVASRGSAFRVKHIVGSFVFRANLDKGAVEQSLNYYLGGRMISMAMPCKSGRVKSVLVAAQLQSLYLFDKMRETTIGEFVNQHPEIVMRAFDSNRILYEPSFLWLEHDGTCDDESINPDLMVCRQDGCYDIYDLKTALLDRSLTRGKRRRRGLSEVVYDGVNQLANYREYFTYEKNSQYAKDRYGVKVHDPKLTLVVGSWENYDPVEIAQACRSVPGVDIIDYDTLIHRFLRSELSLGGD